MRPEPVRDIRLRKPPSRAAKKRTATGKVREAWLATRRVVLERDGYRCRACPSRESIDVHHVRFRSAGGSSTDPKNLLALCRICHADLHAYRLFIGVTSKRGADGPLKFYREKVKPA